MNQAPPTASPRPPAVADRARLPFSVSGRSIGPGAPCFIIAELSANHGGSLERAIATVRAAAEAGADAIKIQSYRPDTITIRSERPEFIVPGNGPWAGRTLYDLYEEAHLPWEWHAPIFEEAKRHGLIAFSTPFDRTAVDLLESLDAPVYKIASFELVDDDLIRYVARLKKPMIISTGMASLEETLHALGVARGAGAERIILLKCTSSYPAPDDSMQLATIPALETATGCMVGLSDHSLGTVASVVAVTFGACVIEKHFTLSRATGGPDSHFSLEPDEFRQLVEQVRQAERMIGEPRFGPGVAEEGSIVFRRSLYVVADVGEGEELTRTNVRSIRPGYGMSPSYLDVVLGRKAIRAIARGTPLDWTHIAT
jgi:N-acetylneuraminate synthase